MNLLFHDFFQDDDFFEDEYLLENLEKHFLEATENKYAVTPCQILLGETRYDDGDTHCCFYAGYFTVATTNHFVVVSTKETNMASIRSFEIFEAPFEIGKAPIFDTSLAEGSLNDFITWSELIHNTVNEIVDWQGIINSYHKLVSEKKEQDSIFIKEAQIYLQFIKDQIVDQIISRKELLLKEGVAEIDYAKLWPNQKKNAIDKLNRELQMVYHEELANFIEELLIPFEPKMYKDTSTLLSRFKMYFVNGNVLGL